MLRKKARNLGQQQWEVRMRISRETKLNRAVTT